MTTPLRLADLLEDTLHANSGRVRADYGAQLKDLGAPATPATRPEETVTMYHVLPWLFQEAITGLADDQLHTLAVAGLLYFGHVLLVDRMLDGDDAFHPSLLLTANAMHERSLVLLADAGLLTPGSAAVLRECTRSYETAAMTERSVTSDDAFGWREYCAIAAGKAAILKASPGMMLAVGTSTAAMSDLNEMLDTFSLAAQVDDDIEDWRKDLRHGRSTFIIGLARLVGYTIDSARELASQPEESIANWLFMEGNAERALGEGAEAALESSRIATRIGAAKWATASRYYGERMSRLRGRCATERVRLRTSARQASRPDALARSAHAALAWIEKRAQSGLDDYAHRMRFRQADGFASDEDQAGSVFQRAVLGWTQNRCVAAGLTVGSRAAEHNLQALLSMRRADERGGWSYFPQLRELPPDADDLGQICLACPPSRLGDLAPAIADARDLLLRQHVRENGGISTWLTDEHGPADLGSRYEWAIKTYWGRGADPEVTANVIYGLDAAGFALPTTVVQNAVSWVKGCQNGDGYWESTWYDGPYYGSYVCCRLIRDKEGDSPSLTRAAEFILKQQRGDGGWGETASECLSTALASLALMETNAPGAREGARRGIEYLRLTQSDSGSWQSGRLIRMNVNRATTGSRPHMLYHGSALLTTCYALAATAGLLAARPD